MFSKIVVFLFLFGCQRPEAEDTFEPIPPTPPVVNDHAETVARVESKFLDRNMVVSRNADGSAAHQGDSLIWSGLYVASSQCDGAIPTETTLQRMILTYKGQVRRHHDIDDASIDGVIGMFRGIARRYKLGCSSSLASWKPALEALKSYAAANHGAINHNSTAGLDLHGYVLDLLLDRLSNGSDRNYRADARDLLAQAMSAWASAVDTGYHLWEAGITAKPPAAYRVNLALQTLETLEDLGVDVPSDARDQFCVSTKDFDMPTTDNYCGRKPITEWLPTFRYNDWEFRHQRAGLWETPDGGGLETPGIDKLEGLRDGFDL